MFELKEEKPERNVVKLFDGKPTTREVFYQKALNNIMALTDENDPAYLIAECVLEYAGEVSYKREKAYTALADTVQQVSSKKRGGGGDGQELQPA